MVPAAVSLTLISKPDCHLCEAAREVVSGVLVDFDDVTLDERSIVDDPALMERYEDDIPVVLVNDRVHTIWRVDAARLRKAIEEARA